MDMLARDPDNVVVMSTENVMEPLSKVLSRRGSHEEVKVATKLIEMCESKETARSSAYQKILSIIFTGSLQALLNGIEDSRRENTLIDMPKLSTIIKHLSSGTGGTISLSMKDKWWEKVEVSSSDHMRGRMLDGDPNTYWESFYGEDSSHWVRLHIKKGVIIKKLYMEIKSSDMALMPQRITVKSGDCASNYRDLSAVYIPPTFTGHYELLSDLTEYHSMITIFITRCQLGGMNVRIHSLTCQASKSSLWPIFGDLYLNRSKLFYHIQVQTWLHNASLGPLELFEKLSNVMLHEQNFAEYFLATLPARQCIGQACRSGIVSPLIDTLTEESAGHMLGKLIQQYMEAMHLVPSQWTSLVFPDTPTSNRMESLSDKDSPEYSQAHETLIQMSCLRRMCRILVDCDDNIMSSGKSEKGEGTKSDNESEDSTDEDGRKKQGPIEVSATPPPAAPGSGTIAVALCWREIVFSEVSKILLQYDKESPMVFCAKLLAVYDKLKQAKLELFGGHSQFAITLKEGFMRAFQQLDEVRVTRVCERLTLSVDVMMDPLNKDAGRFRHLGEHQREALLSKLAEPLQFLHCLDLVYILEFYYRRHLSSRLLRGRSLSVPLERRLAQTFAHVFPNKYPLHMLQDMEDSERLMDRFCDSDFLERLDQVLVHVNAEAELPSEALELSSKCSFYRQRRCQVQVLNSSHWPIRHQYLSLLSLPPPLSSFAEDFGHFFALSHSYGLRQHERARKLHFTMYGWSTLSWGGATLYTSTVQMLILLQFNRNNVMSLTSLHEATRLPYRVLSEALLCLTSDSQAILIPAPTEGKKSKSQSKRLRQRDTASAWGRRETSDVVCVKRFRRSTLFTLNQLFLSGLGTGSFRFEDIHVVQNREGESLAEMLERRRGIIDATIVKILKREKELSQDTVAAMVIKGCSDGHFESGPSFGRFDCTYRDVCARVYRLQVDGYLYHNFPNQQMLVYIPENIPPTTFNFKVPPPEDQKKQAAANPIKQYIRSKKPIKDPFFPKPYEDENIPNLGMLTSCETFDTEKVKSDMWATIDTFSELLAIDRDSTEHLLVHSHWRLLSVLDAYVKQAHSNLISEVGLGPPGALSPAPPADPKLFNLDPVGKSTCQICLHIRKNRDFVSLWCGHPCCTECWAQHMKNRLNVEGVYRITCVMRNCNASPTRKFFLRAFGEEHKATKLYTDSLFRFYVKSQGWLTPCRNPKGCDKILKSHGITLNSCHKCQWMSCVRCSFVESHEPVNCTYLNRWQTDGGYYINMTKHARSEHLTRMIAKKCPSCGIQIEKNEGCMHMRCQCGYHFCWRCLKSWNPTHTDFFSCKGEVSKMAKDEEKFAVYNKNVTSHHRPRQFAEKLCLLVRSISENVPIKTLSFLIDACQLLTDCHKMLSYTYIEVCYNAREHLPDQPPALEYVGFLTETLEGDTHALQAFLENTLLTQPAQYIAHTIRNLTERQLMDGYRLVGKIESTRSKFLIGRHHHLKFGSRPPPKYVRDNYNYSDDSDYSEDEKDETVGTVGCWK